MGQSLAGRRGSIVSPQLDPLILITPGPALGPGEASESCILGRRGQETAVDTLPSDRASWGCPELLMGLTGHTKSKTQ